MKKNIMMLAAVVTTGAAFASTGEYFNWVVREDVNRPVRPAGVEGQPFWNKGAVQYMYPPVLEFPAVKKPGDEKVTVLGAKGFQTTFDENSPTVSLQRVWRKLPVGGVKVVSRGLTNSFCRTAPFKYNGYGKKPYGYAEAVQLGFAFLMRHENVKAFLETGKPAPSYHYNSYPSKMHGALIRAMVTYAKAVPAEREKALTVARAAADYLISISQPKGTPFEYFAPTYQGENYTAKAYAGQNMLIYPAGAANAYIMLYRETKEKKYLEAAVRTARTYAKHQGEDGTWPLKVRESDGTATTKVRLHPFEVITLFRSVAELTGEKDFDVRADRALAFLLNGAAKTWEWNGQFEDVGPSQGYGNLTKDPPCALARILARDKSNDRQLMSLAREMLRWSEDQFVCWEIPYKDEKKPLWGKEWCDWTTSPGVFEQYAYRVPVDSSAATMIRAYLALYRATGNPLDLAKAQTLGDALVRVQAAAPKHSVGKIQTIGFVGNTDFWLNCMVFSMEALAELAESDETFFGKSREPQVSTFNAQQAAFADTNRFAACDLAMPFDVGMTTGRESQRVISHRGEPGFSITPVPCAMYTRAYVLCADNPAPGKEPTFCIRLTRWEDTSEWNYAGRAHEGMAEFKVDLRTAKKIKVGELYLVEVPLDLGDWQDIVKTDPHGNFLGVFKDHKRYLDLEFLGVPRQRCAPLGDRTMDPDPNHVSSVTVYGARLEYPAADFSMRWSEPGNIFHNDEKPVTFCDVTVYKPGDYTLGWTIADAEGKTVKTGTFDVGGGRGATALPIIATNTLDLALSTPGWYALTWRLSDAEDRTLMTHHASFALLGKDTRTSGFGEGPYGIGSAYSWHYRIPDKHYVDGAKLGYKMGVRHYDQPKYGGYKLTVEERRKWKLGTSLFSVLHNDYSPVFRGQKTEEKLAEEMRKRLQDDPNTVLCQLFWESHESCGYAQAPELTGGKYDPAKGYAGASNRVALAKAATKFMRKYFPEIPITIGNTLACTEMVAEFIRGGLPEANADYMGLEVVGRDNLPERQWNSSLQSADLLRETARILGYKSWKPGSGVENNYRLSKVMGQDRQAWWYVRDQVLGQCWRFPSIHVGDMVDAGNQYTESMWGGSGVTHRWPYLYPKKAYVGMATTTKVLDMVTDAQAIQAGDDCVYAVKFTRRDGKFAYGFWTSRATAQLKLDLASGDYEAIDFYGRPLDLSGDFFGWLPCCDSRKNLVASEALTWIVAGADILKGVACVKQSTPNDKPPAEFTVVEKGDDASKWKLVEGPTEDVETGLGSGVPCRVRAKKPSFKVVDDDEMGQCLELDLGEQDLTLPKPVMEYMTLELKEPVAIPKDMESFGLTVKGNSGWGRIYAILEGADGKHTVSTGLREWKDDFDFNGRMTVCYGCWSFARYPIGETTSVTDYSTYGVEDLWSTGCVKHPAKLVGIVFSAENRPLFLTERRAKKQAIRIKDIGFFK